MHVRSITSVDISTYRDQRLSQINPRTKKVISPSTVRLEMSLLSNFFDIGRIEWGIVGDNPVSNVRKPKPPPGRDRRLTAREDRRILRYCYNFSNPELYPIVLLALATAMRQGEILSLTWENINLKGRIAHLPKTKNGTKRDVPLSRVAWDTIVALGVKSSGRLFNYTANGLKSTWRYMMQSLCIEDLHFHDLRHEATSRLFELGTLDIMEISSITGHKSLQMLKRYTHLRANLLVKKLEGNKNRGQQEVVRNVVPYPATIEYREGTHHLRLLDFDDFVISGSCKDEILKIAQDSLLRKIVLMMRESVKIPQPDQYLDNVPENSIVMIDPLALSPH